MKKNPSVAFGVRVSRTLWGSPISSNTEVEAELHAELIGASTALSINGFNTLFSPRHHVPFQSHYLSAVSQPAESPSPSNRHNRIRQERQSVLRQLSQCDL